MTKLEYSDFYKFLASLGIVMIALAILAPWLLLRESFDVSLKSSEISELPPTAQTLISYRQHIALRFVKNIWWVSGILLLLGLVTLCTGVILWWAKKQHFLDQKDELGAEKAKVDLEKARRELASMSAGEIVAKGVKKAEEETRTGEITEQPTVSLITSRVQEYLEVEQVFLEKLVDCFGEETVLTQQKIGQTSYDAILLSDDPRLTDVIFEVKRLTRNFDSGRVDEIVQQLVLSTHTYRETTHRDVTTVALFIIPQEDQDHVVVDECVWAIKDQAQPLDVRIRPIILTEKQLLEIRCSQLLVKVHNAARM